MKSLRLYCLLASVFTVQIALLGQNVEFRGELKKWHKVELVFQGPESSELAIENPFLDYRLDVTFKHADVEYTVPGFYAADGDAAESSADKGNIWIVRFAPDQVGLWTYQVAFKKGQNVAIRTNVAGVASGGFMDGSTGTFSITDSDKTYPDNRSQGRLQYTGGPYLRFADSKKYFIKVGVDAPENLLAYSDIDATTNVFGYRKNWQPHADDVDKLVEDFTWQNGKGKNLMGAINYLASEELNVFSFLTFNVDGDDRNIFPQLLKVSEGEYESYANEKNNRSAWRSLFHTTRFDVSKLEQWERILDYAERKGMFLHFKTHETETDHLMDHGVFGVEGKLYYRELIARFGHHLSMNWNLGEENNQPLEEVKKVATYVHALDPYKHHLVMHTFPNRDDLYDGLMGDQSALTGASLQLRDQEFYDVHERVLKWRWKSEATGKVWALSVDEPGNAQFALLPDDEDPEHKLARINALWGTLMAGGYGVEWYFGYASPNSDLTCEDFRSRDLFWDQNRHARSFFESHVPFWTMAPHDDLVSDITSYCLADPGKAYVAYFRDASNKGTIDLGQDKQFLIRWYDPRTGGDLQVGSTPSVTASRRTVIGLPPIDPQADWVVLITQE